MSAENPYVVFMVESSGAEYETLADWGLYCTSIQISDPQARRFEVEVPGRDGKLDLSDALGGTYFEDRELSMEFVVINHRLENFHLLSSTLRNAIDGRVCRISFSNDLAYFWRGRPQVETEWPGADHTTVRIHATVYPYKLNAVSSYDPWLWDTFNFVTGVITQESDIELSGTVVEVVLPIDPARGKPTLWLNQGTARARISGESTWHALASGENVFPEIRMSAERETTLYLDGTGSVGVEYRVGSL